ncbi:Nucleotidyltransferase [Auricularia subglabra TFB-10046 SS5]|nr:Nucleotidyltransferase [Auricularia subglabra TFB-10046 SS5]
MDDVNQGPLSAKARPLPDVEHREALDVYALLAHRLGLSLLKRELEDAAFEDLHPDDHKRITRLIAGRLPGGEAYVAAMCGQASKLLRDANLEAKAHGGIKRPYSIYQKMSVPGASLAFDEIYDLVGIRVIVQSTPQCYVALGVLHAHWKPVPGRFKNYIAAPKANQYQSLHSTVIDSEGRFVELQICTREMHHRAEHGVAAHEQYKHDSAAEVPTSAKHATLLRRVNDWVRENGEGNPADFEAVRFTVEDDEVVVTAIDGRILRL